jgi:hypothetical protein
LFDAAIHIYVKIYGYAQKLSLETPLGMSLVWAQDSLQLVVAIRCGYLFLLQALRHTIGAD